ncbi:MAG: hypothetical protein ACRDV9_02000 [Acidimicrobiia bacterium]
MLGDVEFVAGEVQDGPAQTEELTASQARHQRQVERRTEPVLGRDPEEPVGFIEGPRGPTPGG